LIEFELYQCLRLFTPMQNIKHKIFSVWSETGCEVPCQSLHIKQYFHNKTV